MSKLNPYESPKQQAEAEPPNPEVQSTSRPVNRVAVFLIGAAITPFLLFSVYLHFTRKMAPGNTDGDSMALIGAGLIGLTFLACTPIRPLARIMLAVLYVPAIGYLLVFYAFLFVGVVFGDGP